MNAYTLHEAFTRIKKFKAEGSTNPVTDCVNIIVFSDKTILTRIDGYRIAQYTVYRKSDQLFNVNVYCRDIKNMDKTNTLTLIGELVTINGCECLKSIIPFIDYERYIPYKNPEDAVCEIDRKLVITELEKSTDIACKLSISTLDRVYVTNALKALKSNKVTLRTNSKNSPTIISEDDAFWLIMPRRS